nr:cell wall-binding protein [uncultured Oribacterium sp.]
MKRSRMVFAACMGLALSFLVGRMSAYAGEESTELRVSSSNMVSTHGTQLFSAGAAYGYGANRQTEEIIIDGIQLREPLKDLMPNAPRDRMRVQELDLRGKNLKLKIHRKGDAPNQFIDVNDISISSPIYYNKMTGESDYERYTEREFTPGDYFYGIELTTRNKNYRFEAGLRNYFSLESSYGETAESRTPLTYRFLFAGDLDEGNQLKLYFFEKNNFLVEEDYPFKEIRMFLPEKDLQYGKLGDEIPHTTWSKMGDGLLDRNGEEAWLEVSIPHKGENKVNCEYALEDVSRGGYYESGSKITKPGTYRRVLRNFTLKMNSISHYRLTFGGVDGSLVTRFYINDKEWKIDPRTSSLDSIDPVTGSLKVTLYDPDYITLRGAGGSTGGSSHSGGSYSGGGSSSGGGSYSGGGSGGSGSSGGSGGGSSIVSGSPAGQVLGADRSLSNGEWVKDEKGWWYKRQDGSYPKSTWGYEAYNGQSYWYYFLDSGYMATGWVDLNGSKYYLFPGSDGWMGRMLTGWQWVDGYCYYFGMDRGNNEGHLYRNEKTPDGYQVDKEGRWVENGVLQIKK